MSDAKLLTEAVKANPTDTTTQLVLADALAEQTGDYPQAVEQAKAVADKALATRTKARVRRQIRGTTVEAIEAQLARANGRRRERTLTLDDVLALVAEVRKHRRVWGAIGGGNVANSYKYPASQTGCVIAVRSNGEIRVAIGEVPASKGTSVTNRLCGLVSRGTVRQWRAWADEQESTA